MSHRVSLKETEVVISTPDGEMPAFFCDPDEHKQKPAIILLMEAFGLTSHIRDVARRMANQGYVVLAPDLYYRELPNNKFGYDEVESAMAMMYRLNFAKVVEEDIKAAITYVKSRPDVFSDQIGVTGFCLGGGLAFLTACKLSNEITAAAAFYGMVLDEWIEAVSNITIPVYLFYGGVDPFIPLARIEQIRSRFETLKKEYTLKVYADADHGYFCQERSSYNHLAAEDSWQELTRFFRQYLPKSV